VMPPYTLVHIQRTFGLHEHATLVKQTHVLVHVLEASLIVCTTRRAKPVILMKLVFKIELVEKLTCHCMRGVEGSVFVMTHWSVFSSCVVYR